MRLLLIDTCGDVGSLALAEDGAVLRESVLPPRAASAHLVASVQAELRAQGWSLSSLAAVAVVNGPGSFTGIRVGLAAAKGLCEVAGMRLLAISRLQVLLRSGDGDPGDLAVLDAGRGEFYVRSADGEEVLESRESLLEQGEGRRLFVAEEKLLGSLAGCSLAFKAISAASALAIAQKTMGEAGDSVAETDANYVRQARGLYASGQTLDRR